MDKTTMNAYEKLQKREHSLKRLRSQLRYGRITEEVFRGEKEAQVLKRYRLTPEEERAIDLHMQMVRQRQRKRK